ncbi:MAG: hypothetical protein ACJ762_06215 [Solirubrobacteraceae bacterium]
MRHALLAAGTATLLLIAGGCGSGDSNVGGQHTSATSTTGAAGQAHSDGSGAGGSGRQTSTTDDAAAAGDPTESAPLRRRDQRAAEQVVRRLYAAIDDHDGKRLCKLLTSTARRKIGTGCAKQMSDLETAAPSRPVRMTGAMRQGRIATVTVQFGKHQTGRVELTKTAGTWKVGEFTLPSA